MPRPRLVWLLHALGLALTSLPAWTAGSGLQVPPGTPGTASKPPPRIGAAAGNLFQARRWQAPPAAVAATAPPVVEPIPTAPPLPFRYLGRRIDDGIVTLFLGQGERTHLVREGDLLPSYRVERIGAQHVTLIYLPLNQAQRLSFGAPS